MTYLSNLLGMLAFSTRALNALAGRRAVLAGTFCFSLGFFTFVSIRNSVYATLPELLYQQPGPLGSFFDLNLIQTVLFSLLVYIPGLVALTNSIAGDGLGFSVSTQEYKAHGSALLPLWGVLFLVAAPLQWLAPQFLIIGDGVFGITVGMLALLLLLLIYTLWAVKQLGYLSLSQALAVCALSLFTLPIFYILTSFLFALPLFIMIPLLYFGVQYVRGHVASQSNTRSFQQNLHTLTLNPQDADAHYQLGLIQLRRGNPDAAQSYFENAVKIDPNDPDYHYSLGCACEIKEEWAKAAEHYEETYRLNSEHGMGDIFREVGKAYVHTGHVAKGIEFLNFFLQKRASDPQGRYWLAIALQQTGDLEQMRVQLKIILEQARSNPRFFRKENREWIYRARNLLRDSRVALKI
jgi:tetratricopeptide (TPR) repeat protein